MPAAPATAQSRATKRGLTGATLGPTAAHKHDPRALTLACALTPVTALLLYACLSTPWAALLALPALAALVKTGLPARRYFIAFSSQNAFPRNLPVFARWAALYAGAMLVMIPLPPDLTPQMRAALWLTLATAVILFPLAKATLRARAVWR